MRIEFRAFKTKVARRIFLLFILCAALPLAASAYIGLYHTRAQIERQGRDRLEEAGRSLASSLYERLFILRAEMRVLVENMDPSRVSSGSPFASIARRDYAMRFRGLALMTANRKTRDLVGSIRSIPAISPVQQQSLKNGEAVLTWEDENNETSLYMTLRAPEHLGSNPLLIAEIQPEYLLSASEGLPPFTEVSVMDPSKRVLLHSSSGMAEPPMEVRNKALASHAGFLDWRAENADIIGSFRSLYLEPNFHCPNWIVLLGAEQEAFLQAGTSFTWSYILLVLFTICLVFFLSVVMIRKSTGPIEELKEATDRISRGELEHRVEIDSKDEFEDLGKSFNEMSRRVQEGQEMLVRAAKMSVMGQMAAGVMHEIKQPLTAIHGLLELNRYEQEGEKRKANDEKALEAVKRLDTILNRFKSFAHLSPVPLQSVSLPEIIRSVYELMEHQFHRANIRTVLDLDAEVPAIQGDPQGLQQVLSNLVINAMDALQERSGDRRLRIALYQERDRAILCVQDNGPGIPDELKERIFEPFFTTKEAGKGSGLGMAIIASILHKHHADLSVESTVGEGAAFTISFAARDAREAGEPGHGEPSFSSERAREAGK